jgi:hypothetical protein
LCRGAPRAVSFPWRSPLLRRGAQVIDGKYDSAFVVDIYQTGAALRQQAVLMRALTRATPLRAVWSRSLRRQRHEHQHERQRGHF